MRSDGALKHFLLAFLLAGVSYALLYAGCEHRRTRKGPWRVTFAVTNSPATDSALVPVVIIDQPNLAISNVQLIFADEPAPSTNSLGTLVFTQPQPVPFPVPFGKCVFMDTMFLPGTLTFRLYGHEIELLPRVLIIDRQEHPWISDNPITLHAVTEPPKP